MERKNEEFSDSQLETHALDRTDSNQDPIRAKIEIGSDTDPATWHGFLHRAIDDRKRFFRLCILLVVTTAALVALSLLAPEALALVAQLLGR